MRKGKGERSEVRREKENGESGRKVRRAGGKEKERKEKVSKDRRGD